MKWEQIQRLRNVLQGSQDSEGNSIPGLVETLQELVRMHNVAEKPGVEVDEAAWDEEQEQLQKKVLELYDIVAEMAEESDMIEDDRGNVIQELPRDSFDRTELPEQAQEVLDDIPGRGPNVSPTSPNPEQGPKPPSEE